MWGASPSPVLLGTYSFGADTLRISLHVQLCSLWVCLCLPVGSLGPKAWCRLGESLSALPCNASLKSQMCCSKAQHHLGASQKQRASQR